MKEVKFYMILISSFIFENIISSFNTKQKYIWAVLTISSTDIYEV